MMLIVRQLCLIGWLSNNENNNYSILVHGLPGKFVWAFATADEGAGIIALRQMWFEIMGGHSAKLPSAD
jgi:hypothetical protein